MGALAELPPVFLVFGYGLVTALATGLGALPFALVSRVSPRAIGVSNAVAAGLMLGACFGLVAEGTSYGAWQTIAGGFAGVLFVLATQRFLAHGPGESGNGQSRKVVLLVVVMTVHSFAEGVAVGASFGGGMKLAAVITAAIAVHNIPEGIAISAVMRPRGASVMRCAAWSIFSSLPQPVMAVPAFLFVSAFTQLLPYGIGFAAGAMVFMVLVELLPEAYEQAPQATIGLVASISLVLMVLFQSFL